MVVGGRFITHLIIDTRRDLKDVLMQRLLR